MERRQFDRSSGFSLIEVALVLFVIAIVLMLGSIEIVKIRGGSARDTSSNNLRQLGIALEGMADVYGGKLPPSYTYAEAGGAPGTFQGKDGSFFFFVLPSIEQVNVYNQQSLTTPIKTYYAPLDDTHPYNNNQISYWSNASALKPVCGGEGYGAKFPKAFNQKGLSNVAIFGHHSVNITKQVG